MIVLAGYWSEPVRAKGPRGGDLKTDPSRAANGLKATLAAIPVPGAFWGWVEMIRMTKQFEDIARTVEERKLDPKGRNKRKGIYQYKQEMKEKKDLKEEIWEILGARVNRTKRVAFDNQGWARGSEDLENWVADSNLPGHYVHMGPVARGHAQLTFTPVEKWVADTSPAAHFVHVGTSARAVGHAHLTFDLDLTLVFQELEDVCRILNKTGTPRWVSSR